MSIGLPNLFGLAGLLASSAALADVPRVAADIAPVHSLLSRVMDGIGEPTLIVQPGASPHAYSMRPSEARDVQKADAIFGSVLSSSRGSRKRSPISRPRRRAELLDSEGTTTLDYRTGATFALKDPPTRGSWRAQPW